MSDLLQILKLGLAAELEKQGSSLLEFEQELAQMEKEGAFDPLSAAVGAGGSLIKGFGGLLGAIPELAATGSIMAGTLGGSAAYGMHRHLSDQDKELKQKQDEIARVRELTHRLKSDYGIQ